MAVSLKSLPRIVYTFLYLHIIITRPDLAEGHEAYKDGGGQLHEAGYDAFVTGSCFAHMVRYLGQ